MSHSLTLWIPAIAAALPFPGLAQGHLSDGPFDAPSVVVEGDQPPLRVLVDLDRDGDLDLVAARQRVDGLEFEYRAWTNAGGQLVGGATGLVTPTVPTARYARQWMPVVAADVDGDGDDDIVVATGVGYHVLESDGSGQLTASEHSLQGTAPIESMAAADLDGDGRDDLVLVRTANQQSFVEVHTGAGVWSMAGANPLAPFFAHRVLLVEADGDPAPEIGVWSDTDLHVLDAAAGSVVAVTVLTTARRSNHWAAGDLDGDGDDDLVAFGTSYNVNLRREYQWFEQRGAQWVAQTTREGGPAEFLADVDGDGDLDGVCCSSGGGGGSTGGFYVPPDYPSQFEIAIGDGAGGFASAWTFPGLGSERMAGTADLDGDGNLDLVAGAAVLPGRGDWSLVPQPSTGLGPNGRSMATFDVDRDGDPDLDVRPDGIRRNRGDGSYRLSTPSLPAAPAGTEYRQPSVSGDFDGDGTADFLMTHVDRASGAVISTVLIRGAGADRWNDVRPATAAGVRLGAGIVPSFYHPVDLDGDGDLDLIADSIGRGAVLWRNDGTGFLSQWLVSASDDVELVRDFDGDGRPDLLLSASGATSISLATVGGGFGAAQRLPTGVGVPPFHGAYAAADVDGDGLPELATIGRSGSSNPRVLLWHNTSVVGAVSFRVVSVGAELFEPASQTAIADLDGDGRVDVLAGPIDGIDAVAVYRNVNGQPGTLSATDFAPAVLQLAPPRFDLMDADGDGDLDLVGDRVVRGVRFHGLAGGVRRQYGVGSAGEGGVTPVLGAVGPFRSGSPIEVRLSGVPGPSMALLAFGSTAGSTVPPIRPGAPLLIEPSTLGWDWLPIPGIGEGRGAAAAIYPVVVPGRLAGLRIALQAIVLDTSAPRGVTTSNGVALTVGF